MRSCEALLRITLNALLPEFDFGGAVAAILIVRRGQHWQAKKYRARCTQVDLAIIREAWV